MLLILMGSTTLASAQYVTLTGGDPSGGLTLNNSTVVDAFFSPYYLSPVTTLPFQGVTFNDFKGNPNFTTNATLFINPSGTPDTAANAGFTNVLSPTTEDNNLLNLMNAGLSFENATPDVVTISGLAHNTNYVVDSIISLLGYAPGRNLSVGYNGNAPLGGDSGTISQNGIFDFHDIVTSDAIGDITLTYASSDSDPFFNAIVISNFSSVPEPSTWAMMLAGVVFLGFRMRRKSSEFQI